jgi:hypothetical protein
MEDLACGFSLGACSDDGAAALDEQDVAPSAVVAADAFSGADDPESGGLVEVKARAALREDPSGMGLEGGMARIDPGLVDGQYGAGVRRGHGGDLHALAAVPGELPGVAEDGAQGLERIRDQRVVGPYAALVAGQDPGLDQDLEVVRDGGLGQAERLSQVTDA